MGFRSFFCPTESSDVTCDRIVFKNDSWLVRMDQLGLQTGFVGKDLECPKATKQKLISLFVAAEDPIGITREDVLAIPPGDKDALAIAAENALRENRDLFFKSLNKHRRDEFTKEIRFKKHNLVLNYSALHQEEVIRLKDPRLLINTDGDPYTAIQYLGSYKIWRLGLGGVVGSYEDRPHLLESIEQGFSIEVYLKTGEPCRQDFETPGPPTSCSAVFGSSQPPTWNSS